MRSLQGNGASTMNEDEKVGFAAGVFTTLTMLMGLCALLVWVLS